MLIAAVLLVGLGLLAALALRPERVSDSESGPSVGVQRPGVPSEAPEPDPPDPTEAPVPAPPHPDVEPPVTHAAREE